MAAIALGIVFSPSKGILLQRPPPSVLLICALTSPPCKCPHPCSISVAVSVGGWRNLPDNIMSLVSKITPCRNIEMQQKRPCLVTTPVSHSVVANACMHICLLWHQKPCIFRSPLWKRGTQNSCAFKLLSCHLACRYHAGHLLIKSKLHLIESGLNFP